MRFPVWSSSSIIMCVCLWFLLGSRPAHAYIDPGTGSYLLQLLIGGLFAGAFILKSFWGKTRASLARAFHRGRDRVVDE
jgi:hypothetical protein